jgi:membrane-associated phospholipid phosphatase
MMRTWWRNRLILLGLSCLLFCALFIYLAPGVVDGETRAIDQAIRQWMLAHHTPLGLTVVRTATRVGERLLIVGAVVVAWLLVKRGAGFPAIVLCAMPLVSPLIVDELKDLYQVIRPDAQPERPGFPSGHTSAGTAMALALGYGLIREGIAPRVGLAVAITSPLLVGVSRIFLDRHWASDVVGGWIVGTALAGAVCVLYELMRLTRELPAEPLPGDPDGGADAGV